MPSLRSVQLPSACKACLQDCLLCHALAKCSPATATCMQDSFKSPAFPNGTAGMLQKLIHPHCQTLHVACHFKTLCHTAECTSMSHDCIFVTDLCKITLLCFLQRSVACINAAPEHRCQWLHAVMYKPKVTPNLCALC